MAGTKTGRKYIKKKFYKQDWKAFSLIGCAIYEWQIFQIYGNLPTAWLLYNYCPKKLKTARDW